MKNHSALLHLHGGVGIPPYKVSRSKLVAKRFYDRTLGKFTIKNSDIIASVSRSDLVRIAEDYNISPNMLRYIPNAVDTEVFKPRSNDGQDKKTILYLGDLEHWKGIGSLIKWVRNASWTNCEFKLRIVGQGTYLPCLLDLQKIQDKCLNGISLEVLGPRRHSEIPAIMNESSALILPSYWEGLPTVVLEAMASGIPVISTRVGDIPYLIRNKETGILIDRTFESFRNAVDSVLNDRRLVSSITKRARNIVEDEYTLSNIHRIVTNVYDDMAS